MEDRWLVSSKPGIHALKERVIALSQVLLLNAFFSNHSSSEDPCHFSRLMCKIGGWRAEIPHPSRITWHHGSSQTSGLFPDRCTLCCLSLTPLRGPDSRFHCLMLTPWPPVHRFQTPKTSCLKAMPRLSGSQVLPEHPLPCVADATCPQFSCLR